MIEILPEISNFSLGKNLEKFGWYLKKNFSWILLTILNHLFGNDVNEMLSKGHSGLLNENISAFLRKGIKHSQNNSFLNAISYIHNDEWNNRNEIDFIENQIIKNLTPELFCTLNNGNLVLVGVQKKNEKI